MSSKTFSFSRKSSKAGKKSKKNVFDSLIDSTKVTKDVKKGSIMSLINESTNQENSELSDLKNVLSAKPRKKSDKDFKIYDFDSSGEKVITLPKKPLSIIGQTLLLEVIKQAKSMPTLPKMVDYEIPNFNKKTSLSLFSDNSELTKMLNTLKNVKSEQTTKSKRTRNFIDDDDILSSFKPEPHKIPEILEPPDENLKPPELMKQLEDEFFVNDLTSKSLGKIIAL